jgi:hypothetical protein
MSETNSAPDRVHAAEGEIDTVFERWWHQRDGRRGYFLFCYDNTHGDPHVAGCSLASGHRGRHATHSGDGRVQKIWGVDEGPFGLDLEGRW